MTITNHTVVVKINGIDRTTTLKKDSLFARYSIGNRNSVCEFELVNFTPNDRDQVELIVNGTTIFGGYIIERSAEAIGVTPKTVNWKCTAKDWSLLFDQISISTAFTQVSDSSILSSLFSTYLTGFDASTYVSSQDADLDIEFTSVTFREALDQLAERVGANWYISPAKELFWFAPTSPSAAAFNIDTVSPNETTTFDVAFNSVKRTIDSTSIINQVVVNGGTNATQEKITDVLTGDGTSKSFSGLTELVDSVLYVSYTDTDDNAYTTWGSFVGYAPDDRLISEGGTKTVVIGTGRKTIKLEGNSGQAPKSGTDITVVYYIKGLINITVDDLGSQGTFGVSTYNLINQDFTSEEQAQEIAQAIIDQNKDGKETLSFDVFQHGLLPGTLIEVSIPDLDIGTAADNFLLLENQDYLWLQDNTNITIESYGDTQSYLIQEISFIPIEVRTGEFLVVARVQCGKYQRDLIDSLATLNELKASPGVRILNPSPTKISNISSNLGEIVVGRATFTDGGTAKFAWGSPNGATGAVIGLEDTGSNAYGAAYIYDQGTVKAKLGRLDDVPAIGTIQPTGWGLYTSNGFFSGTVGASQIVSGTITGNLISGGTVTGSLISGGTVTGNLVSGGTINGALIIGGTIATSTPPINSGNPGVYLDATGLYGYGSAGLTFRLSSDPAIKPYFSSGTIENVTYEVTTASVIRTSTSNPKIQIDNSGIFSYNSGGTLKFSVDASTGLVTATGATISGTITSSLVSAGTVSGGTVTGSLITGGTVSGGIVSGGTVTGARVTAGTITGVTITANNISGGTVSGALVTAGTVSGGTVTGALVTGGTISAVSGSVTMTGSGLSFIAPSSYISGDARNIKFTTSGSVVGEVTGLSSGSFPGVWLVGGVYNNRLGLVRMVSNGTTTTYTDYQQWDTFFQFLVSANPKFEVHDTEIRSYTDIVPDSTANNRQLGTSSKAFRYLYLKDDGGVTRRVSIDSGGNLVVT